MGRTPADGPGKWPTIPRPIDPRPTADMPSMPVQPDPSADARHWRLSRRLAAWVALGWAVVSFVPLLFARQLGGELFGAPLVMWICSQGAPVAFVLLVWRYERTMARLDDERLQGRGDA